MCSFAKLKTLSVCISPETAVKLMPQDADSQHIFRKWLGRVRQQTITWASVDQNPCCHIMSLCHMTNVDQNPCCYIMSLCHMTNVDQNPCCHIMSLCHMTNVDQNPCRHIMSLCHMTNVDQDPCYHIVSQGHNELNVTWHTWCSQSAGFFATGISPHTHVHNSCYHHWCLLHQSHHVQRQLYWGLGCHFRDVPGRGLDIVSLNLVMEIFLQKWLGHYGEMSRSGCNICIKRECSYCLKYVQPINSWKCMDMFSASWLLMSGY